MAWNFKFFRDFNTRSLIADATIRSETYGFKFVNDDGWGSNIFIKHSNLARFAKDHANRESQTVYIDGERPQSIDYTIQGILTYRVIPDPQCGDMTHEAQNFVCEVKNFPWRFLYLTEEKQHYPAKPAMLTQESRMANLLASAADSTGGVTTFRVGPSETEFKVDDRLLTSVFKVPIAHEQMREGSTKIVMLPEENPAVFKIVQTFVFTLDVPTSDMKKYVFELLQFSDKYACEMLHWKCEYYLCWRVQNTHIKVEMAEILTAAVNHNANTLKLACFHFLYTYGTKFMSSEEFDDLPQKTAVELVRFFASQRESHMPEVKRQKIRDEKEPGFVPPPPRQPLPQQQIQLFQPPQPQPPAAPVPDAATLHAQVNNAQVVIATGLMDLAAAQVMVVQQEANADAAAESGAATTGNGAGAPKRRRPVRGGGKGNTSGRSGN